MPRRILIAYDGSEASYHALQQAVEVAQAEDAEVGVVTVLRPERSAAEEAAAYLLDRGFEPDVYTPVGDPAVEIRRVAEEHGYDTIYVGTRGRGSLIRALEGSVSSAVAEGAEVTVVIAR
jgi:nucleotide-binding universal stress UspA family protein